jgi:metal-responsive CopG/Arc/MetJ family transcriptional regulator
MSQRRITVTLSDELYQELLRRGNKSAFVREALQAYVARLRQCDVASQIRDYCTRESEHDRALCSELDGSIDDGTTAQG